jgi:photosystem II stability/assembly factor-like uncharacterized protein
MFYDIDVAQSDGRHYGGGAQDNGTLVTNRGRADLFHQVLDGDGGWIVYDPRNAAHYFGSFYNFNITRFRGRESKDVSPKNATRKERNAVWMVYIVLDPDDSQTVYSATTRMWRSVNDGRTWKPISEDLDGDVVSAIEVAPADTRYIYAGTEKGGFFRSTDGGKTWSGDMSSSTLPGMIITRIETHPRDAERVYVTVGGTGHGHVYRSDDGGATWRDIDGGRLPDSPHHAIVIRPDRPYTMWVASDASVFQSADDGATWRNISGNMPHTSFVDLVYHRKDRRLTVATYGRSMYRARL